MIRAVRLPGIEDFSLKLPEGTRFLHIDRVFGVLWTIIESGAPEREYRFRVLGVDQPFPAAVLDEFQYIDAFHVASPLDPGSIRVYHLLVAPFEKPSLTFQLDSKS
jgi:hypothetical protein